MTDQQAAEETVLVTAATGTVGRHVVRGLHDRGVAVRVGSRTPDAARDHFDGIDEFVDVGFDRPETWGRALEGATAMFLVRPPAVSVDRIGEFVDAAARVGVSRVVYLSTLGAEKNILLPHHRIERRIVASGMTYSFLRASFFMQNLHEVHARDVIERDELFLPAGTGETSFVDARDVGAAAAILLAGERDWKHAYDLTGPAALRYDEVATVFRDVLDREITYANPSLLRFVARTLSQGHSVGYALLLAGIYTTARVGLAGRVSDDAAQLLGRPPRSLRTYVEDYADEFRAAD